MSRHSDSRSTPGFGVTNQALGWKSARALTLCLVAACSRAQDQSASSISREVEDVFARASRAVVKVRGGDEESDVCVAGVFIYATGALYTFHGVVGEPGT